MKAFPVTPTSVALVSEGTDVFISFHFEADTPNEAERLCQPLQIWLELFLQLQGFEPIRVDLGGHDEQRT